MYRKNGSEVAVENLTSLWHDNVSYSLKVSCKSGVFFKHLLSGVFFKLFITCFKRRIGLITANQLHVVIA